MISASQLLRVVSAPTITRWTASGRLYRLHPGIYAVGHRAVGIAGRLHAALLYAGPNAALSNQTAGWWWRLLETEPSTIHISIPGARLDRPGVRIHHPRTVERITHRGLAVTPIPRTLRDLFWVLPYTTARRALAEADHLGLLDAVTVYAELGRGRRGSTLLRRAMEEHLPELAATFSVLEERFLSLIADADFQLPEVNAWVEGMLVDCVWRERRLIVELDGHETHDRSAAIENDRRREMRLRRAGFTVLRYTWRQVTREAHLIVAELRPRLASVRTAGVE